MKQKTSRKHRVMNIIYNRLIQNIGNLYIAAHYCVIFLDYSSIIRLLVIGNIDYLPVYKVTRIKGNNNLDIN